MLKLLQALAENPEIELRIQFCQKTSMITCVALNKRARKQREIAYAPSLLCEYVIAGPVEDELADMIADPDLNAMLNVTEDPLCQASSQRREMYPSITSIIEDALGG